MGLASPSHLLLCGPFHQKHDTVFGARVLGETAGIRVWSSTIFGVDHLHTLVVGDAHAVVAILDNVGVAYVVQAHRRSQGLVSGRCPPWRPAKPV